MPSDSSSELKAEIGHVLFIDIVGYSKLLINEQTELLEQLKQMVRNSEQVHAAESENKLITLPTGDGMALVFRNSPEAPARCALELSRADKEHPELQLRMGIHSGPINAVTDLNDRTNVTGAGINMAQRVMDCGDAGHILLSKRAADDLQEYRHWQPLLHELGECEVKHGVRLSIVNLYADDAGNAALPTLLAAQKRSGSVEKVLVLSAVIYKWGGHERSWTCAVCPCGVGSEPGSCTCLQSSFFSTAFHSAPVVSDFMFDALRGLDVSRGGSSSGRAW
jgi:hypothetical protein